MAFLFSLTSPKRVTFKEAVSVYLYIASLNLGY